MKIEGAVLVGGESRRMGRDKSSLTLAGRKIVDRLCEAMTPLVERVRLVGGDIARPTPLRVGHQRDLRPGLGPLGGIHAALATARAPAVLVVACDLPFVTTRLLREIVETAAAAPEADAVLPRPDSGPVPVCALYRASCLDALSRRLDRHDLGATDFVLSLNVRWLDEARLRALDPGGRCLFNMNVPSDYETAQAMARQTPESDA